MARGLETEWEKRLQDLSDAESELVLRENMRPGLLTDANKEKLRELGADINKVWTAPTTTDRDRKQLLRTVLEEVIVKIERKATKVHLTLRWRGGAMSDLELELKRRNPPPIRTDEDTVELVRRLATHYYDQVIAGILNRQGRLTATGARFTANSVCSLRRYWKIPKFESKSASMEGELLTIDKAAAVLEVAPSTVHRWLAEGFMAGEQVTPGAPWRIRMTDELRARIVEKEVEGYVPMIKATQLLGVTRQTIMQRVKRGELHAVHIRSGKANALRIKVVTESRSESETQLSVFSDTQIVKTT